MDSSPKPSQDRTPDASDDDICKGSDEVKQQSYRYEMFQTEKKERFSNTVVIVCILVTFLFNVGLWMFVKSSPESADHQCTSMEEAIKLKTDFEVITKELTAMMKDTLTTEMQNRKQLKEKINKELKLKEEKEKLESENTELKSYINVLKHEVHTMKKNINISADSNTKNTRIIKRSNLVCCSHTNLHFQHVQYGCIFGNRSLVVGDTDYIDVLFMFKLMSKKHIDEGMVLFEFGFTSAMDVNRHIEYPSLPAITAYRCRHPFGVCLDIENNNVSINLGNDLMVNKTEYINGKITMKLINSHVIMLSDTNIINVFTIQNVSVGQSLRPTFAIYNPHVINISLSISSDNPISFNRSTVDPHLYISGDNSTISNWEIPDVPTTVGADMVKGDREKGGEKGRIRRRGRR